MVWTSTTTIPTRWCWCGQGNGKEMFSLSFPTVILTWNSCLFPECHHFAITQLHIKRLGTTLCENTSSSLSDQLRNVPDKHWVTRYEPSAMARLVITSLLMGLRLRHLGGHSRKHQVQMSVQRVSYLAVEQEVLPCGIRGGTIEQKLLLYVISTTLL